MFFSSPDTETIRNRMWYGNDTLWRSVLDLNKILLYADAEGKMHEDRQRKYISIVDGVLGGENNGPMAPDRKESGVIIIGTNPVAVDTVGATLMGFDYKKIPSISNGYKSVDNSLFDYKSESINIKSNNTDYEKYIGDITYEKSLKFVPHFGWRGHIELEECN